MQKYNINANLVRIIEQLYDKKTSAVQMNSSTGEWFRTNFLNIFLKWIMTDALEIMMERLAYAAEILPIGSLPKT